MLVGYLMTTKPPAEIKVDERRGERRLSGEARDPERRRGERRRHPSLDSELRSRGYATVQCEAGPSPTGETSPPPLMAWQPRSTRPQRAARAGRRLRARWGVIVGLLAAVGVVIVVARTVDRPPAPPLTTPRSPAPRSPAPQIEQAPQPPPTSQAPVSKAPPSKPEIVGPTAPPPPAPSATPAPVRVVSTRSSGVVLSVDPRGNALVLEDRGVAGRRRVELAPDARVVLSERDDKAENLSHPFKDTVIGLSEVRRGDYVVVEMRGPEGKELARSVVVTFRPN